MSARPPLDWEAEYDIPTIHPDLDEYLETWSGEAEAFRRATPGDLDISYGTSERQRLDVFFPEAAPLALVVFFHGGFWVSGDRSTYSHLAAGPLARGLAFALAGYDLAPDVTMDEIAAQAAEAVAFAADTYELPVVVAGHSAGGHLSALAIANPTVPTRHGVAVSGLFDLEPFLQLKLNRLLRLDASSVKSLSPILRQPPGGASLRIAVGADETTEFLRQSAAMGEAWAKAGASTATVEIPARHHLTVIKGLAEPDGHLARMCEDASKAAAGAPE